MKTLFTTVLLICAGGSVFAADNESKMAKEELIRQDYERLTETFRFTLSAGDEARTSALGTFTIDPKTPKTGGGN